MATSEHAVGEVITRIADDDDRSGPTVVRPALRTLLLDQAALLDPSNLNREIDHGLRTGFPDMAGLVEWYQRAVVRTFGHVATKWPPADLLADHTLIAATVDDLPPAVDPMGQARAERLRELYETVVVHPACVDAYTELRTSATEYVGTDDEDVGPYEVDPERQANVAMRPGYQLLDQQQRRTLRTLWGGFDERERLLDWLHTLNAPTAGEIDGGLAQDIWTDSVALEHLLHAPDTAQAQAYRVALAVTELLPAFVAGVTSMSASEAIQSKRDPNPWNEVSD